MEKAKKDFDNDGELESPEQEYKGVKDKAIKKAKGVAEDAEYDTGDYDIGHVDDEPDMLMGTVYDIALYSVKVYKALKHLKDYPGEVDLPNWWQAKLILARDYVSKAQHYLEHELKQEDIESGITGIIDTRDNFLDEVQISDEEYDKHIDKLLSLLERLIGEYIINVNDANEVLRLFKERGIKAATEKLKSVIALKNVKE